MRRRWFILVISIALSWGAGSAFAADEAAATDTTLKEKKKDSSSFYYTFVGIIGEGGGNQITYSDWVKDKWETIDYTGSYSGGGLMCGLFTDHLIGEFSLQYISNGDKGDPDISVSYTMATALGKFAWFFFKFFGIAAGAGLYMELPPFINDYSGGAGFAGTFGFVFNLGGDFKIIIEGIARSGHFGLGEESTITSFGGRFGFVYNVGRL